MISSICALALSIHDPIFFKLFFADALLDICCSIKLKGDQPVLRELAGDVMEEFGDTKLEFC